MPTHRDYQTVRTEELVGEEVKLRGEGMSWSDTEIIPTTTRSFVVYLSLLLISFTANVLLVLDNARLKASGDSGKTIYSGNSFTTLSTFHSFTQYWNPNLAQETTDAAWSAIDTNPIAVALHNDFVNHVGLGPSTKFPWDTERSVYYIRAFHDLHCLKLIRKAIISQHHNDSQTVNLEHIYHCLDSLRQDIMCIADDTPMPAPVAHHVGDGQVRKCRDWNKLVAWATHPDRNACHCFDDYREATNTLELFAFCPDNSPYRDVMQKCFNYHGHKNAYEPKNHGEGTIKLQS
ncbi:hypothetical protein BS50DRAFT_550406 [Corynespora cassiicola Philippines]|uniref:Uncharacterized protein n=1 Tax=Corynespora cassiicola Philippines TaxID=1448308 RepID=A0A2T2NVQ1_CORCC|nr:hypothetical protein BS50DRAFT_550406 [Corynespora cassiicola Philippines]